MSIHELIKKYGPLGVHICHRTAAGVTIITMQSARLYQRIERCGPAGDLMKEVEDTCEQMIKQEEEMTA